MTTVVDIDKMRLPFQEEWLVVNETPTLVLKLGQIQPDLPLMLILPGRFLQTYLTFTMVFNYYQKLFQT